MGARFPVIVYSEQGCGFFYLFVNSVHCKVNHVIVSVECSTCLVLFPPASSRGLSLGSPASHWRGRQAWCYHFWLRRILPKCQRGGNVAWAKHRWVTQFITRVSSLSPWRKAPQWSSPCGRWQSSLARRRPRLLGWRRCCLTKDVYN